MHHHGTAVVAACNEEGSILIVERVECLVGRRLVDSPAGCGVSYDGVVQLIVALGESGREDAGVVEVDGKGRLHVVDLGLLVRGQAVLIHVRFSKPLVYFLISILEFIYLLAQPGQVGHVYLAVLLGVSRQLGRREIDIVHRGVAHDGVIYMAASLILGGIVGSVGLELNHTEAYLQVERYIQMFALHQTGVEHSCLQVGQADGSFHVGRGLQFPRFLEFFYLRDIEDVVQAMNHGGVERLAGVLLVLHVHGIVEVDARTQSLVSKGLSAAVGGCLTLIVVELPHRNALELASGITDGQRGAAIHLREVFVDDQRQRLGTVVGHLPVENLCPVSTFLQSGGP